MPPSAVHAKRSDRFDHSLSGGGSNARLANNLTNPKLVILHVSANRTAYDAGHIPGARFVAQSDLVVTRDGVPNELPETGDLKRVLEAAGVSDDSRVILYSDSPVLPPLARNSRCTIWATAIKPRCSMAVSKNGAAKDAP